MCIIIQDYVNNKILLRLGSKEINITISKKHIIVKLTRIKILVKLIVF